MAYGPSSRVRGGATAAAPSPRSHMPAPEEWADDSVQDEAFDTALHLASHAQRLKNMEGHFARMEHNLKQMRYQAGMDRQRQNVLMGILAGGFILSILITAFARPSVSPASAARQMQPSAPRVAADAFSAPSLSSASASLSQGLAMAGAQLQPAMPSQGGAAPMPQPAAPVPQQMINALQAPAPAGQQVPLYAKPQAVPQQVQQPVQAPRYEQGLLPATSLAPAQMQPPVYAPQYQQPVQPQYQPQPQPQPRPRSAFEQQVRTRLAARGENVPADWQGFFERDSKGDRKGRLLVAGKFLKGESVGRDQAFAVEIIRGAADEGEKEAMMWLGYANQGGNLGRVDMVSAVRWFEAAARAGVAQANAELGRIFEKGVDGVPDVETAISWYQRGKQAGDSKSAEALMRLQQRPLSQQAAALAPQAALSADPAAQEVQRLVQSGLQGSVQGATAESSDVFMPAAAAPIPPAPPPAPSSAMAARPVAASMPMPSSQVGMDAEQAAGDVRAVQRMLRALGYKIDAVDGEFGPETASAIRTYQRDRALYPDGEPTPQLMEALSRDMRAGE